VLVNTVHVGITQTNCYVVGCEHTREGVVIDPGDEAERILDVVATEALSIRYVFNTHCHFDHIGANAEVVAATGAPLALHPAELPILRARGGAQLFGVWVEESPLPDMELGDGDELVVGRLRFQVRHTPGHSPGGLSFYLAEEGAVFDGDLLFANGVGRTDLPGGDWNALARSIRDVLFALPGETVVYPGHGPTTTVDHEQRFNPFVGRVGQQGSMQSGG
jgi:glyoxylase-like metal-dependent hydrolase (beta-lactamase superfamily II)